VISAVCFSIAASFAHAQNTETQRVFEATKAEVEKQLRDCHANSGGKLPTLEGFANGGGHPLDRYKRGYYQYEVQVRSLSPTRTSVRVRAKITAWYTDPAATKSGYEILPSNGRLEADLLESMDEGLHPNSAKGSSGGLTKQVPLSSRDANGIAYKRLPDTPSTSAPSPYFTTPRLPTSPSTQRNEAAGARNDPGTQRQMQELQREITNLSQILQDQSRPSDLAVIKSSHTPVMSQPVEGAPALFLADAEDEFKVLDSTEGWVHVQISGISRGWIQKRQVDMPGAARVSLSLLTSEHTDHDSFRETKEEVTVFPGKWAPLDGKQVKIIWVQPLESDDFGSEPRWNLAKAVFRKADPDVYKDLPDVAGVVVIFDSQDGGMAAAPMPTLQQWRAGHLPDETFLKRCWLDPADAFKIRN
jgi:hypothetical protein